MGRIARSVSAPEVLVGATRHCATEAKHAALLTEVLAKLGGTIDPSAEAIQTHYSEDGGIPKDLVDLLVLSEILEARVLMSYREHLQRSDVHPQIRRTLERIIREEEAHSGDQGWAEQWLTTVPADRVTAAKAKWERVDQKVAAELHSRLANEFIPGGAV
jgi:bacterioferritin (cytochrome b1)